MQPFQKSWSSSQPVNLFPTSAALPKPVQLFPTSEPLSNQCNSSQISAAVPKPVQLFRTSEPLSNQCNSSQSVQLSPNQCNLPNSVQLFPDSCSSSQVNAEIPEAKPRRPCVDITLARIEHGADFNWTCHSPRPLARPLQNPRHLATYCRLLTV
ncbi:hypothetical protein BaRGS_00004399 [Batillaria attramentaria]|uniref:Uncharacterized protein n=1 Tax=Batillaria attramentaria TaxID=370345 RepID=A0ABD0LYK5_9CAEN